jgi:branched-chain amino acid transport system permease protein
VTPVGLPDIDPDSVMSFRFSLLMALPAVLGGIGTL